MDDKIYRGPGHPVGAHFHSGPKGERGLPGVSPKVDMTYNEDDGTVVFTVTDGYGQREQTAPMAELMDDWMEHDSYEVLKQWMDTHSDAEWWVDENHGLHLSNVPPDADDRIVDAVDDWLDDHPEATTTVQDGSITKAKLDTSLKKAVSRVVDTFEDLYNTTEDEVTVLKDDSYFGSGQTVTFMKADNVLAPSLSHLQRANGDYMVPKPNGHPEASDVPTQAIGEVVASYINRPEIVYGGNGAFSTSCDSEMDCSIFAQLVMQGISYEHSRYVEGNDENDFGKYVGNNIPKNKSSLMDTSRTTGYNTTEIALWLAEQNRLHYIDYSKEHPCSQLRVGDVLFESDPEGDVGVSYIANRYLYIHHIVVVLAVYPESDRIVIAEAGSSHTGNEYVFPQGLNYRRDNIKISTLSIGDNPTKHALYGRPRYGVATSNPISVPSQFFFNDSATINTTTTTKQIGQLFVNTPLNPHKMYTLVLKGKLPQFSTEKACVALFHSVTSGSRIEMTPTVFIDCGDEIAIPFVPVSESDSAKTLPIIVYYRTAEASTAVEHTYRLEESGLFEGLHPSISPNAVRVDRSIITEENGVTLSNVFLWKQDGKLHLRFNASLDAAVSSATDKVIAQLNLGIQSFGTSRIFTCFCGGQGRRATLSTGNALSVYYQSGEGASYANFDIVI